MLEDPRSPSDPPRPAIGGIFIVAGAAEADTAEVPAQKASAAAARAALEVLGSTPATPPDAPWRRSISPRAAEPTRHVAQSALEFPTQAQQPQLISQPLRRSHWRGER